MRSRAAPFLALSLIAGLAAAQDVNPVWMPVPGRYSSARVSAVLPSGASGEYRFREAGDGIWRPLTGPLDLTALPREERTYVLQVRAARGSERFEAEAVYVIDRLPPPAPSISPPQGSYEGPAEIRLASEPGAAIYYSLEALDRPSRGFLPYDPDRPPSMERPRDGTRAWTLSAYAVDSAGNPGPISTARYVVEPQPSGPRAAESAKAPGPAVTEGADLEHRIERKAPGSAAVVFPAQEGARIFAAVNPRDPSDPGYYSELSSAGGEAVLELSAPVGWVGPLVIRYARWEGGTLVRAPEGVEVRFTFEDPGKPPPVPAEPVVLYPPGTRTILLTWEPSPFRIEVAVGSGPFTPYALPISVPAPQGSEGVAVRYRAVGPAGAVSEVRSLTLVPPNQPVLPELSGLPDTGRTSRDVRPRTVPGSFVRYEVSTEGFPPPVSATSPLLTEEVSFPGAEGKDVRYSLRFRAFSDSGPEAVGSDERFAEFTVDRSPPPAPRLSAGSLTGEDEEDRIIAFEPGEGTIRFAVLEKGNPAEPAYRDYSGPVTLEGSGDRPRAYEVYAYAVDEAGNRSETLGPVSVRIDRASVYVASWGSDTGGGGPRNPLATISAGVEAATRSGRRIVRVQGDVPLGSPVRAEADIEILGGCDESWESVAGRRSAIDAAGIPGPLFIVPGVHLVLRNLAVTADWAGDSTFAEVSEGSFTASGLAIRLRARGELAVFRTRDSSLDLADSEIEVSGALFARIVQAVGGTTRVRGVKIFAKESLGYLTAFSLAGGSAEIARMRSESRTSGGFTLVRGVGTRFQLRDSYLNSRGSGFCEVFRFEESQAALYMTSADLDCAGPLTFASVEGGKIDVLHSTAVLRGGPVVFLDLAYATLRLGNSVLLDGSGLGILLRTKEAPQRGSVVRNALSGFRTYLEGPRTAVTVDALNLVAAPPDGLNFPETFRSSDAPGSSGLPLLPSESVGAGGAYPLAIPSEDPALPEPVRKDVGAIEGSF